MKAQQEFFHFNELSLSSGKIRDEKKAVLSEFLSDVAKVKLFSFHSQRQTKKEENKFQTLETYDWSHERIIHSFLNGFREKNTSVR